MNIEELTEVVKEQSKTRSREERVRLLQVSNIIDENGFFHEDYFSKETVEYDRKYGKPIIL
jgi:hypothetical protein